MIVCPGPRLLRARPRRSRKGTVTAELNLTALVDVLTVLVIFALINFNPPGELLT